MFEIKAEKKNNCRAVCFSHPAPPGHQVMLAGIFNDWDPKRNPMEYSEAESAYTCTVFLAPGEYEYKLVVDGEWLLDEGNPNFVSNDFGTLNSVLSLK